MKKLLAGGNTSFDNVLPEYGRKKLLMYADTFRDLANTFSDMHKREEELQPVGGRASAYGMPEGGRETSGCGMETGRETPGYGMEMGMETPGYGMETGRETPGYSTETGRETPGYSTETGRETPGYSTEMGREASGYGTEMGREMLDYGMETGSGMPGYGAAPEDGMSGRDKPQVLDRQEYLWKRRLVENRDLMADHLMEMAQIMTRIAEESYRFIHMSERKVKQLSHALKEENILLKEVCLLEKENGHKEINLVMRAGKNANPAVEEVGNLLSVLLNLRLVPSRSSSIFVGKEWGSYQYMEEPKFHVLTGVAKAVKETESISGDNYSFMEVKEGMLTAVLSDGMGSGDKACKDSELIIDFIEKFLEAGFAKETAVQMINGALIAGGENQNMSTLDMCQLDLYTGICEFIKIGSAPSYIKRENLVEQISARNFPLGVFYEIDMETVRRRLMDGDYIIMLSDGILDGLSQGIGEEMLPEMLGKITLKNPAEMANHILNFCLHQSRGRVRDDMTVMVVGVWESL